MTSTDGLVEEDSLEKGLLTGSARHEYGEADDETVLYDASFEDLEDSYVKYQTAQWVLYSLLLILAWGVGLLMLLYVPVRRHILRKDFRSRKLYVTPDSIVYKVSRPVAFPCFGVLKKEKHVLLPSVADIVIEQGYLQSRFGIYSIRIENAGVRKPASDDVQIEGIADPREFRKAVLMRLPNTDESSSRQSLVNEDPLSLGSAPPPIRTPSRSLKQDLSPSYGEMVLQKLEEVGNSVKRVQTLIEKQTQTSDLPV
ncbi:uncharacterized protein A4U43_C08F35360 [Asparagus officinalis]|uniref:uncharacterized protein LOC109822356 n=1 Tax=Asparagus officinalis TaxID=4686 RepID=UPI00098E648A|nr:uncharacterized protein LOC109822356 [Asparagus officinalis]ONK61959.1 uncharacterized protein A4U43_C08F35360 [Asparagus officinalis]